LIGEIPYNIRRKMNKKWPETYVAGPLIQHITHNVKLACQAIDHQNLTRLILSNPRVAETLMDLKERSL
jgi:hypothetical protein